MIREKQTVSGRLFEADFYPVWNDGRRMPSRVPKHKRSTAEQQKYNHKQAVKNCIRMINVNFNETDHILHPTYEPSKAPQNEKQARRDLQNALKRLKRRREKELKITEQALAAIPNIKELESQRNILEKKRDKLNEPFKYIYVVEKVTYKSGKYAGRDNWHFHLFITGGLDRDETEKMWHGGMRTNCDRFQPDKFGPEAMAKYMMKDPQGSKRFVHSRNLQKPNPPKIRDGKITKRGVERLAKFRNDDAEYWENRYKGYRFVRCFQRYNSYNGHYYVSVVMIKTEGKELPQWRLEEWIDE